MSEEAKSVEITETVEPTKSEITVEQAKESGLNASEIADAKRFGLVTEEEKPEAKEEAPAEEAKTEEAPATEEKRKPENADIRELVEQELDPEKEAEAVKDFKPNEKALYWKFKKEKRQRQRLEEEVKTLREKADSGDKTQAVIDELRREIAALKGEPATEEVAEDEDLDRPLTKRELMELAKKEQEKAQRQREEQEKRVAATREKLNHFEETARERYEDFDRAIELSNELLRKGDELLPAGHPHRKKAEAVAKRLKFALENLDQFSDDYSVADIAYELGELHPRFNSKSAPDSASQSGKQEPGLSPDQMERLRKNANRPPVSASVTGGAGKRVLSEDDITPAMVARMTSKEFSKLSEKTKARLLGKPD